MPVNWIIGGRTLLSRNQVVNGIAEARPSRATTMAVATVSPKQPSVKRLRDWYPYYAGFTERFVNAVVDDYLQGAESVVDPWSGAGTTTVACLRRGVESFGVDINPAATVIARARLNPKSVRQNLIDTAQSLVEEAQATQLRKDPDDLLALWMVGDGLHEIRALVRAIRVKFAVPTENPCTEDVLRTESLSHFACFLYTVCFGVVRSLLSGYRTTNPMWIKSPGTSCSRISPERHIVRELFLQQAAGLAARLSLTDAQADRPFSPLKTGSAAATGYRTHAFDAAITSPPYATRIDYIRGSLPELAVLGADEKYVEKLRLTCTGSPKVKGVASSNEPIQSRSASDLLRAIKEHPSKGSRSYYLPCMANYLRSLQAGLRETHRVVKPHGAICVVVQDSYYKEIHIDMQGIVAEILGAAGRSVVACRDYPAPNPRRKQQSGRQSHTTIRPSIESLLVFGGRVGK